MICKYCKKENDADAKFCFSCGKPMEEEIKGSVDEYFAKQYKGCQICGSLAPTRQVEFNQNIGYLIMRSYSTMKGRLCKRCIDKEFWKKTSITFFFGWWGTISFFVTPVYLIGNVFSFVPTIGMKKESKNVL